MLKIKSTSTKTPVKITLKQPQTPPTLFSDLTLRMTKVLSPDVKRDNGIYFTPFSTVIQTMERVNQIPGFTYRSVLEPSCGTGQFLEHIQAESITGVEFNDHIYREICDSGRFPGIEFRNGDFLKMDFAEQKFDLIVGNPPYFVVPKNIVQRKYAPFVTGRPNIYILFILKSLDLLTENGVLAFVLPNNFLNCQYYEKLRKLIYEEFTIIDILPQQKAYIDTEQNTCIVIIQKRPNIYNDRFRVNLPLIVLNTPDMVIKLNKLLLNTSTLADLGFDVKVGNVVWNQCKDILTDDATETRLIYSSDISDDFSLSLTAFSDPNKKNYIRKQGTQDTVLLVNRGYGKGKYVFKYCLLEAPEFPYLIENHITCIYRVNVDADFQTIINSFNDPRTLEFVDLYFENNAINTMELKHILPIRN